MKYLVSVVLWSLLAAPLLAAPGDENWDTGWSLPGTDAEVTSVIEYGGDLVITGFFDYVGDVAADGVARFDGTSWSAIGAGVPGDIYCSVIYGGDLYVGGEINDGGGPL
ncbi:hypothetical protein H8E07_22135, partial [bacterium]|nr:hypothetical protein [bacterium]